MEWDNQSSTLNDEEPAQTKQQWNAEDIRVAKNERKMAKNQVRFDIITKRDLEVVQDALHRRDKIVDGVDDFPKGQGLMDNPTIEANIAFNSNCFKFGSTRHTVHEKNMLKRANRAHKKEIEDDVQIDKIISTVMTGLGVQTSTTKTTKELKRLHARLRTAITDDLKSFDNEQRETMERMAGYWRYANKRTYNQMVENNELWDWATGQKLLKVEEENGLDVIEEEDEDTEADQVDDSLDIRYHDRGGNAGELDDDAWGRFEDLHLRSLSYSPGRSPGPTCTFRVPSPSPSDDRYAEDWDFLDEDDFTVVPKARIKPRIPLSSISPNKKPSAAFKVTKDVRTIGRAAMIREASPPRETQPAPTPPAWHRKAQLPTAVPRNANEAVTNHYAALQIEVSEPLEETENPKPVIEAKVVTLAVPVQNAKREDEEGWQQVEGGPKRGRKGGPAPTKNKPKASPLKDMEDLPPVAKKPAAAKKQTSKVFTSPVNFKGKVRATPAKVGGGTTYASVAALPVPGRKRR